MENAPTRAGLLELLHQAYAEEHKFVAGLSDAERAETGTRERWSAKDLLAHISYWRDRLRHNLALKAHGRNVPEAEQPPLDLAETDEVNAQVFDMNHERTFDEVQGDAERIFRELVAQLDAFSDMELTDPNPSGWFANRSLASTISGSSFEHVLTHISYWHLERGDRVRARELQERAVDAIQKFDPSPNSRAAAIYNLACFHALMGESDRAVELLREALPMRPDLVDWSKQDPDLVSLRELPEYQALYAG